MKNYRIIKGKKIHLNQLASMSRKFTVKNNVIGTKSSTVKIGKDTEVPVIVQNGVAYYRTPWKSKITRPGSLYIVSDKENKYGLHFSPAPVVEWETVRHKQPKNLRKKYKKKYYCKGSKEIRKVVEHPSDYTQFKNYPYTLPKMNRVQYCEKLVEHKLKKWERKNPAPADMFTEDVEKWKQLRETMKERFRDFVVSIYDPLPLTGRFVVAKEGSAKYTEEKVAEIKDINGDGHRVNEVTKDSKLIQKAQKITNETKAKRKNLIATNLKDHKRQKGRIILPEVA